MCGRLTTARLFGTDTTFGENQAMHENATRRDLIRVGTHSTVAAILGGIPGAVTAADTPSGAANASPWPGFPRQDARLVAEVVGMAHRDEARVRELVTAHPPLVNAWWDWGFGDWESPLGAASHVGQRGIAEFLLERGARIDIFAAAMLGLTDVVKAFVTARPGVQRTLGPHGIPLLAHAKVGGPRAADTVAYLEGLGDAGTGLKVAPLPPEQKGAYLGKFVSAEADVRLECRANKNGQLVIEVRVGKADPAPRVMNIHHVGEDEFFPSGVPSVRIRFTVENGKATSLAIRSREPILTARREDG
jgi:hypothetical protein